MLKDKNVVITGASSGVGEALAFTFARNGANLHLIARNYVKLQEIKLKIERMYPVSVCIYACDLLQREQREATFSEIMSTYMIDVLVNNAGIGYFEMFEQIPLEQDEQMIQLNVVVPIACTKLVVPSMKRRNAGIIVNIASVAGVVTTPKSIVYGATKHALLGFGDGLRLELTPYNIQVTNILPGPIATAFHEKADPTGNYLTSVNRIVLTSEQVAEATVSAIVRKKRSVFLPNWMWWSKLFYALVPNLVDRLGRSLLFKK